MSVSVYHIQIGDGSQYQKPVEERPEGVKEWLKWHKDNRIPPQSGVLGEADSSVLWADCMMLVRLALRGDTDEPDVNEQPDVLVAMDVHQWESLVALVASQRRELELRTPADPDDKTEEVS